MDPKHETCDRCEKLCITKDDYLLGPLDEEYEFVCNKCARSLEAVHFPLKWKKQQP